MQVQTLISGYSLKNNGWYRVGGKWWRGVDSVTYDGCDFLFCSFKNIVWEDGSGYISHAIKVNFIEELNQK